MPRYFIQAIVNTQRGEYDHNIPNEQSLDAAMARILEMYPKATSVVMSIVPEAEEYPAVFG